eukprot:TRINITY_DN31190_c0_g1_i1.p2 TRINITY_DN31190_c0_g1~~TRINITY_DN31190_c0_g1_i1.p2  ORF type:complete len:205 (-),score=40.18 TRINITY_DN31190_c0_g1_i1:11-625(-)
MASRAVTRLQKELRDIRAAAAEGKDAQVSATSVADDLRHWKAWIKGPEGTPYVGGIFHIDVVIPDDYPFSPPKMKFDTKIWHPNMSSQTGAICLDVLGKEWSPALMIRTALLSIQTLLTSPEPDDPQDAEVAQMYKSDRELFNNTAKYWTEIFASGDCAPNDDDAQKAVDKGTTHKPLPTEQATPAPEQHRCAPTSRARTCMIC